MNPRTKKNKNGVGQLIAVMARLRADGGCPWDKEQTHESLIRYLIEETYELIDAIEEKNDAHIAEELGDVLLQVIFHSQIAQEQNRFNLQDVGQRCAEKLIRRHPHVYGNKTIHDSAGVRKQWEEIKKVERSDRSTLDGVPRYLPALSQAEKIQKKAARVGFDWPTLEGVVEKIDEELDELKKGLRKGDPKNIREELGDLLFSIVNLARFVDANPEEVLRGTIQKFYTRFQFIEKEVAKKGKAVSDCSLEELDRLWNRAKRARPRRTNR